MDMSQAYISAVSSNLPHATIVFDHFHVIKLMNEKLTELRRDLYREATDLLQKDVLKGTRWLLLKNPENLRDDRNERARLEEALSLNKPLATAYYMKEDLRLLWSLPEQGYCRGPSARLDRPGRSIRYPNTQGLCQDPEHSQTGNPRLLRPSNLHRTTRRNQQQDQDTATTGIRLQRPSLLHAPYLRPSHHQVRTGRVRPSVRYTYAKTQRLEFPPGV